MTTELTVLAWGCLLALVHIFGTAHVKTRQLCGKSLQVIDFPAV